LSCEEEEDVEKESPVSPAKHVLRASGVEGSWSSDEKGIRCRSCNFRRAWRLNRNPTSHEDHRAILLITCV